MDNLGAVSGIITTLFLFKILGYQKLFLIAAIPSIMASLLILFAIKEKKTLKIKIYEGISFKKISKNFRLFLILSSIFALGSFSYSFLLIYAKKIGFQTKLIPFLYLLLTITASFSSFPFGKLSDKIGRKKVLVIAYFLWGLVLLSFIFQCYQLIIVAFILYGLHKGALEPSQKAFVSELAPVRYKASSMGAFQMTIGLFSLPASLLTGILWDKIGIFVPLYLSLGLTSLSILMMALID